MPVCWGTSIVAGKGTEMIVAGSRIMQTNYGGPEVKGDCEPENSPVA